ncbi:putative zinc ribbon protein [Escherichia coli]|uniref:putative zinc ribbon protein n=1 Tax=Escherichia coli TaxID=562 RepID=UPI003D9ABB3B
MRILNCYMANDSKGHFVTAKEAAKHNRRPEDSVFPGQLRRKYANSELLYGE